MNTKKVENAVAEARRFIERAEEYPNSAPRQGAWFYEEWKYSAAMKRASMDLTRALVYVRTPTEREEDEK